jgi:hypothetical protein
MEQLQHFLSHQLGAHEISLCITIDSVTIPEIKKTCIDAGYTEINIPDITGTGKYMIEITPANIQQVYNLAAQYGSGQWNIGDTWVNPDYNNLSVIGIISKDYLVETEKTMSLLSHVGMTIQI